MSRAAPFDLSLVDPTNKVSVRSQKANLLSDLLADIRQFRDSNFPPDLLQQVRDLPIYYGNKATVRAYYKKWQHLIDRAQAFYPSANMAPDFLPLPANLEIPQFIWNADRIHLTKTKAKESKSFGSIAALVDKCGDYSQKDLDTIQACIDAQDGGDFKLVAHRDFVDLRTYAFCRDDNGEPLEPQRIRFYKTGLILAVPSDFEIVDSRQFVRKRRSDAYTDPIADNGVWRVFFKVI